MRCAFAREMEHTSVEEEVERKKIAKVEANEEKKNSEFRHAHKGQTHQLVACGSERDRSSASVIIFTAHTHIDCTHFSFYFFPLSLSDSLIPHLRLRLIGFCVTVRFTAKH